MERTLTTPGSDDASHGYWVHDAFGPKHYVGADAPAAPDETPGNLVAAVEHCLAADPHLDASCVHVSLDGDRFILSGSVETADDRIKAEICASNASAGQVQISNRLRVRATKTDAGDQAV